MSEVRLIDANALTKIIERELYYAENTTIHKTLNYCLGAIQNAPTVELFCAYLSDGEVRQPCVEAPCKYERPQGEWKNGYIFALDKAFFKFDANCTYSGDRVLQILEKLKEEKGGAE